MTPPGPGRIAAVVGIPRFRLDELEAFRHWWQTYGDLYHVPGRRNLWVCSHPDLVQEVLVTNRRPWQRINELADGQPVGLNIALGDGLLTTDGDDWQWRRRIVNPAFHRQRIEAMTKTMIRSGEEMLGRLHRAGDTGEPIDLMVEMKRVTQDIISRTMFSVEISGDADRIGGAVDETLQYVSRRERAVVNIPTSWPTPARRRFIRALGELDAAIYRGIAERRASHDGGDDLLAMLLEAVDEETGQKLSDQQVRNEIATVYGAGHETTANALTWVWHELMLAPEVLSRLQTEADTGPVDDFRRLTYTRMVLEEILRFRPPVPINARVATKPTTLGGYDVAPGAIALLITNNVHRHPHFWERPNDFYPEHFATEAKETRHRWAWSPFGAGPHLCIGNNFAMTEGCLLLAMMAKEFTFRPANPLPRKPAVAVTMKPKGGLRVKVEPR